MSHKTEPQKTIEILKNESLYNGFIKLSKLTARVPSKDGGSMEIVREIHDHGDAVAILPVNVERRTALMVGQWRLPAYLNGCRERLWEAPAGLIDKNETSEETAKREALEETGYQVRNIRKVADAFSSPGLVTERIEVFLADYTDKDKITDRLGVEDEGEDIILKEFSFNELFEITDKCQLHDAVSIIAVQALRREIQE